MSVHVDADAGLGFSVLHRQRVRAVELLDERRLAPWADRALPATPEPPALMTRVRRLARPELVRMLKQSRLKSPDGADLIDVLIRRLQLA